MERQGTVVALIFALMALLLVLFGGICAIRSALGQHVGDAFVTWGVTTAFLAPLTIAAVLGGLTLNRYGGLVGLVFGIGFELAVVGSQLGESMTAAVGVVLLVGSVPLFFVLGRIRRVPMWLRSRSGSRLMVDDGLAEGEDRPGHVADR